ncbi:MAG: SH3 domain-containing protein [Bacteroidetes bacterium]|nr:SH3 domain-containing protein [Bacteroidota bacterium]
MNTRLILLALIALIMVACSNPAEKDGGGAKPSSVDSTAASSTDKQEATSQERYKTGDDLFVFAKSGLTLRKTPDKEGEKVSTLPFGSKVNVVDADLESDPYTTKEPCGLEMTGHWVRVKSGQKEGFLFDGYLLTLDPDAILDPEAYWTTVSKVKSTSDKGPHADVEYYEYKSTVWENGVTFTDQGYVGGNSATLTLPKSLVSFQEAYLLAMATLQNDPANPMTCNCDVDKEDLDCSSKDEMQGTSLRVDKNGDYEIMDSVAD